MKFIKKFLPIVLFTICIIIKAINVRAQNAIIPIPNKMERLEGNININPNLSIFYRGKPSESAKKTIDFLQNEIYSFTSTKPIISNQLIDNQNTTQIILEKKKLQDLNVEGYKLYTDQNKIYIQFNSDSGMFYGCITAIQLFENKGGKVSFPNIYIEDSPRFQWRGLMLDVSRHFYDMAYLKKMINVMAYLKMNTFHLHLTDDQGWRIEIKKYPNLTKMGAFRDDLRSQKWTYFQYGVSGNKPVYGGFYTQNEMKELVAYASEKNITIIPEIDLPGHSWSAIYSYNNLSCSGKTWKKPNDVPFQFSDPLCVCDPNVLQFTKDVMTEIIDIFPSQYIHIGGDECRHEAWNDYVTCRDLMKKENLKNTAELQSWFNRELEAHIISKGRKIIGWDEILEGGITPSAAVMSWRGEKGGIEAAKHHHQVVMSPATHCYLDMPQSVTEKSEGWLKLLPLEKVYSYEPTPDTLTSDEKKYILGVQGNLWTENVQTTEQADYQFFPRGVAIAEVAWSNVSKKNYKDFLERLNTWYQILDKFKVQYAVPNPYLLLKEYVIIKPTYLKPIFDKNNNSKVVYTLDGTEPNQNSSVLNDSVLVSKSGTLKMVSVLKNGSISKTFSAEIKLQQPLVSNLMSNNLDKGRLNTNYYEGIINSIKEWNKLKLISKFKSEKIEIPKLARKDSFAVDFEGFIEIPITGVYTFSLTSDDGSILYINDTEFINYDGTHGAEEKSKQIAFEKGIFKFKLSYFEALYGETLNLYIEGPGLPKQAIPSSMIYTSK